MIPLRATFHYTEEVEVDSENEDHAEFWGLPYAIEKRISHGYITDILELKDVDKIRALIGSKEENGRKREDYKDEVITRSGVYVVFWEDFGDYYKMVIEDYNRFTVSRKEIEEYVRKSRSA